MADWTAITGIVVSGVLGPGLGALYASRRLEREHDYSLLAADRAEARDILDGATQNLQRAGRLRGPLYSMFVTHGAYTAQRATTHIEKFHEVARLVDLDTARLELRLGASAPVVVAHRTAWEAILLASDAIGDAGVMGEHADLRSTSDKLKESGEAFGLAEMEYMVAAHKLAKAQLERPRRKRAAGH